MALAISEIFNANKAALAPLAGVADSVFRRICVGLGACPVMTEMVSSDGFVRGHPSGKTMQLLEFCESERPIGVQFFGADPDIMSEAVQKVQDLKPDFIDINAGCPVKKVISRKCGVALMRKPGLLANIIEKAVRVSKVPITVKIRSGWDESSINAVEIARICVDSGAHAVIVHPRTRNQGFRGVSDWSVIRRVKENVSVPVVGSGDIRIPYDAVRMKEETGVDYVMVGRGAMGNPWIFSGINECFDRNVISKHPCIVEKLELALKQLDQLAEEKSEHFAVFNMRKFFGWYSKGVRGGAAFRQNVFRAETIEKVKEVVRDFQNECKKNESVDNLYIAMVKS